MDTAQSLISRSLQSSEGDRQDRIQCKGLSADVDAGRGSGQGSLGDDAQPLTQVTP